MKGWRSSFGAMLSAFKSQPPSRTDLLRMEREAQARLSERRGRVENKASARKTA